jgi:hypothetical protein
LSQEIDVEKFQTWLNAAAKQFDRKPGDVITVEDDMDEIDPDWWWKAGTIEEAGSVFRGIAAAMPSDFAWNLVVIVVLKSAPRLDALPPNVGEMVVDTFFPPYLHLHAGESYMVPGWSGCEEHSWTWSEDPWGLTGDRTRVSFSHWSLISEDDDWGPEDQLVFRYYGGSGGNSVSAWAPG